MFLQGLLLLGITAVDPFTRQLPINSTTRDGRCGLTGMLAHGRSNEKAGYLSGEIRTRGGQVRLR
jgi:hypothetical protein